MSSVQASISWHFQTQPHTSDPFNMTKLDPDASQIWIMSAKVQRVTNNYEGFTEPNDQMVSKGRVLSHVLLHIIHPKCTRTIQVENLHACGELLPHPKSVYEPLTDNEVLKRLLLYRFRKSHITVSSRSSSLVRRSRYML